MIQRPNICHFKGFDMTDLQYKIRVPQKSIGEPQYTTGLGMIFYGTDVTKKYFLWKRLILRQNVSATLLTEFCNEGHLFSRAN